jgi:hypothetical protein
MWWEDIFGGGDQPSTSSGFGGVGGDASVSGTGGGIDWGSIGEAVASAFGGSSSGFGGSGTDQSVMSPNFGQDDRTQFAANKEDDEGIIGKITGFANKNKGLTEMLLKGVAGGLAADQAQSDRKALMREQQAIANEDNARVSASVSGLRGPGIIAKQAALKRINGDQIFTANGRINRG